MIVSIPSGSVDKEPKVIYLVVGSAEQYTPLFGAYSDEAKAKSRVRQILVGADVMEPVFIHEMVIDHDTEDCI
jgi:hypothetical protein